MNNLLAFIFLFTLIGFDFFFLGCLPRFFKIWPALDKTIGEILVKQHLSFGWQKDFKFKYFGFRSNFDFYTGSCLILTNKFLLIKNTPLTYIWRINIESIRYFEVKKILVGNIIRFNFIQEGRSHFFEFPTLKLEDWLKHLSEVGILERKKETA